MNTRIKLLATSAVIAGLWCTAPMAQTANPPNTGSSASGQSGSGVTPRTTGGSAMPTSKEDGIKLRKKSAAAPAAGTTMGDKSASGSTMTTASAAPARKPKRDRN